MSVQCCDHPANNRKTPHCLQSYDHLLKDNEELHADVTVSFFHVVPVACEMREPII